MLKKIIGSLFCGLIVTLWCMQNDIWLKERIGHALVGMLQKALGCTMRGQIAKINFFIPSLELTELLVTPSGSQATYWAWSAQKFTLSSSWIEFLLCKVIPLHVHVQTATMYSAVYNNTRIGIMDFIDKIRYGTQTALPISLRSLLVSDGTAHIVDEKRALHIQGIVHAEFKKLHNNILKAIVRLWDFVVQHHDKILYAQGDAIMQAQVVQKKPKSLITYTISGAGIFPHALPNSPCSFSLAWDGDAGCATIKNSNQSLAVEPFRFYRSNNTLIGQLNLSCSLDYLSSLLMIDLLKKNITGQATADVAFRLGNTLTLNGTIILQDVVYKSHELCNSALINFNNYQTDWIGSLNIFRNQTNIITGTWQWNLDDNSGSISVANATKLMLPGMMPWYSPENSLEALFQLTDHGYSLIHRGTWHHTKSDEIVTTQAAAFFDKQKFSVKGAIKDHTFDLEGTMNPTWQLHNALCKTKNNESLLRMYSLDQCNHILAGELNLNILAQFIRQTTDYSINADGILNFKTLYRNNTGYVTMAMNSGVVRLPDFQTTLNSAYMQAIISPQERLCVVRKSAILFNQGKLSCQRLTIRWKPDGSINFVHIPVMVQNIHWLDKNFLASLSGALVYTNQSSNNSLQGMLTLDHMRISNFINQLDWYKTMQRPPHMKTIWPEIALSLYIATKLPISIKSPWFKIQAMLNATINGTVQKPIISGQIELLTGELLFPYRPLYITKGSVYFATPQLNNPIIELRAHNTLKGYDVALHINGSMQHHTISLESSPSLKQEQILALLLGGSQDYSLTAAMPRLIIQNLKNIMQNPIAQLSTFDSYLQRFLQPLKSIHLVPSFTDQSGRGGLRGALEIEVCDRLHGRIQRNFNTTEDTRIEIDYVLSDDILLKGVRNEHGDIGAEIEMRWKF